MEFLGHRLNALAIIAPRDQGGFKVHKRCVRKGDCTFEPLACRERFQTTRKNDPVMQSGIDNSAFANSEPTLGVDVNRDAIQYFFHESFSGSKFDSSANLLALFRERQSHLSFDSEV